MAQLFKEFIKNTLDEEEHKNPYTKNDLDTLSKLISNTDDKGTLKVLNKVKQHMQDELKTKI